MNAALCTSGIAVEQPKLHLRATPFALKMVGQAVVPPPWIAVDPVAHGVHVRVDGATGSGGVDAVVPGGALANRIGWRRSVDGRKWVFTDPTGANAGVRRVVLQDLSPTRPGLLRWHVAARVGTISLPAVSDVRSTIVLGAATECVAQTWNGPTSPRPHCTGDATRLQCR